MGRIKKIDIPGDINGSLGRFILTQTESCAKEIMRLSEDSSEQFLCEGLIARTILLCLDKAKNHSA